MKTRGFTLIELLAVIVILAVIALIATPIILGLIADTKQSAFKDTAYGISQSAKNAFVEIMYAGEEPKNVAYNYVDGVETSNPNGYALNYEGSKPQNGQVALKTDGQVALVLHDGKYCATKGYSEAEITLAEKTWEECESLIIGITGISFQSDFDETKGVNRPKLATGMTPIKWNGSAWIDTTVDDTSWYIYDTTNKNWANARTNDGSMWVWIPRYIYKISSNHHAATAGTVEIQFSKGTNDNWNNAVIGAIDIGTGASASNNKWTNHPGFKFGDSELTGIWVAKFEATAVEGVASANTADTTCAIVGDDVTTKTIKISPSAVSWRCINPNNAFTNVRNMETKSVYGWSVSSGLNADGTFTTDTNNLDTHLMKNIEWGAAIYLSKSQYGKNTDEIWINNANDYKTGCAANSVSDVSSITGCLNAYNTTNGLKASTTGNIYGVYDMAGGSWERISAYVNNGNGNLSTYGSIIVSAISKYKDIYTVGGTDDQATNYGLTNTFKGDAVWETSSTGSSTSTSWFSDDSNIFYTSNPWLARGGGFGNNTSSGAFAFHYLVGNVSPNITFRPVLLVGAGL